jgi:predicted GH43/DUF377 family glycosyl hydrolase
MKKIRKKFMDKTKRHEVMLRVIARAPDFIMEPEAYYEKFGLFIPNVIFPTGNVVKDDLLWIYYGCCDTAIGLATVPLNDLVDHIFATSRK